MADISDTAAQDDDAASFPLVHYLPVGVLVANEGGSVSLVNQALFDIFGLDGQPEGWIGRSLVAVHAELAEKAKLPELVLDDETGTHDPSHRVPGRRIDLANGRHVIKESLSVNVSSGQRWVYLYRDATAEIQASDQAAAAQARAEEIAEQVASFLFCSCGSSLK